MEHRPCTLCVPLSLLRISTGSDEDLITDTDTDTTTAAPSSLRLHVNDSAKTLELRAVGGAVRASYNFARVSTSNEGSAKRKRSSAATSVSADEQCNLEVVRAAVQCIRNGDVTPGRVTIACEDLTATIRVRVEFQCRVPCDTSAHLESEDFFLYFRCLVLAHVRHASVGQQQQQQQQFNSSSSGPVSPLPSQPLRCVQDVVTAIVPDRTKVLSDAVQRFCSATTNNNARRLTPHMYQLQAIDWMYTCRERRGRLDGAGAHTDTCTSSSDPLLNLAECIKSRGWTVPADCSLVDSPRAANHPLFRVLPQAADASTPSSSFSDIEGNSCTCTYYYNPHTGLVVRDVCLSLASASSSSQSQSSAVADFASKDCGVSMIPPAVVSPVVDGVRSGGLLCDEMGLGKTLEVLGLISVNPFCPSTAPVHDTRGQRTTTISHTAASTSQTPSSSSMTYPPTVYRCEASDVPESEPPSPLPLLSGTADLEAALARLTITQLKRGLVALRRAVSQPQQSALPAFLSTSEQSASVFGLYYQQLQPQQQQQGESAAAGALAPWVDNYTVPHPPTLRSDHAPSTSASPLLPSRSTLVIVPSSIVGQWRGEVQAWAPWLSVYEYEGIEALRETEVNALRVSAAAAGRDSNRSSGSGSKKAGSRSSCDIENGSRSSGAIERGITCTPSRGVGGYNAAESLSVAASTTNAATSSSPANATYFTPLRGSSSASRAAAAAASDTSESDDDIFASPQLLRSAAHLATADIVLVSFDTLARDLAFSNTTAAERTFRNQKRYPTYLSLLLRFHWHRIVLDEAQMMVDSRRGGNITPAVHSRSYPSSSSSASSFPALPSSHSSSLSSRALMACKLAGTHRWAVSGTPLDCVADVRALLKFLRHVPFGIDTWFNRMLLPGLSQRAAAAAVITNETVASAASSTTSDRTVASSLNVMGFESEWATSDATVEDWEGAIPATSARSSVEQPPPPPPPSLLLLYNILLPCVWRNSIARVRNEMKDLPPVHYVLIQVQLSNTEESCYRALLDAARRRFAEPLQLLQSAAAHFLKAKYGSSSSSSCSSSSGDSTTSTSDIPDAITAGAALFSNESSLNSLFSSVRLSIAGILEACSSPQSSSTAVNLLIHIASGGGAVTGSRGGGTGAAAVVHSLSELLSAMTSSASCALEDAKFDAYSACCAVGAAALRIAERCTSRRSTVSEMAASSPLLSSLSATSASSLPTASSPAADVAVPELLRCARAWSAFSVIAFQRGWSISQRVEVSRVTYRDEATALRRWRLLDIATLSNIATLCDAVGDASAAQEARTSLQQEVLEPFLSGRMALQLTVALQELRGAAQRALAAVSTVPSIGKRRANMHFQLSPLVDACCVDPHSAAVVTEFCTNASAIEWPFKSSESSSSSLDSSDACVVDESRVETIGDASALALLECAKRKGAPLDSFAAILENTSSSSSGGSSISSTGSGGNSLLGLSTRLLLDPRAPASPRSASLIIAALEAKRRLKEVAAILSTGAQAADLRATLGACETLRDALDEGNAVSRVNLRSACLAQLLQFRRPWDSDGGNMSSSSSSSDDINKTSGGSISCNMSSGCISSNASSGSGSSAGGGNSGSLARQRVREWLTSSPSAVSPRIHEFTARLRLLRVATPARMHDPAAALLSMGCGSWLCASAAESTRGVANNSSSSPSSSPSSGSSIISSCSRGSNSSHESSRADAHAGATCAASDISTAACDAIGASKYDMSGDAHERSSDASLGFGPPSQWTASKWSRAHSAVAAQLRTLDDVIDFDRMAVEVRAREAECCVARASMKAALQATTAGFINIDDWLQTCSSSETASTARSRQALLTSLVNWRRSTISELAVGAAIDSNDTSMDVQATPVRPAVADCDSSALSLHPACIEAMRAEVESTNAHDDVTGGSAFSPSPVRRAIANITSGTTTVQSPARSLHTDVTSGTALAPMHALLADVAACEAKVRERASKWRYLMGVGMLQQKREAPSASSVPSPSSSSSLLLSSSSSSVAVEVDAAAPTSSASEVAAAASECDALPRVLAEPLQLPEQHSVNINYEPPAEFRTTTTVTLVDEAPAELHSTTTVTTAIVDEAPAQPPAVAAVASSAAATTSSIMMCGVCSSDLSTSSTAHPCLTPCGHFYCHDCLLRWVRVRASASASPTCPECRAGFAESDLLVVDDRGPAGWELRALPEGGREVLAAALRSAASHASRDPDDVMMMNETTTPCARAADARLPDDARLQSTSLVRSLDDDDDDAESHRLQSIDVYPSRAVNSTTLPTALGAGADNKYGTKTIVLVRRLLSLPASHKAVVVTRWPTLLNLLREAIQRAGIGVRVLKGSPSERSRAVEAFSATSATTVDAGSCRVLLLLSSTDCAGITLTAASHLFLMEPTDSHSVTSQLVARIARQGQCRPCVVYHIVPAGSVEERGFLLREARLSGDAEVLLCSTRDEALLQSQEAPSPTLLPDARLHDTRGLEAVRDAVAELRWLLG